jgi:acyl-CoA thioesterase-2
MTTAESAWTRYPNHRIDLVPIGTTAQVWSGDLLLAESAGCLRLEETKHVDRVYFPEADVRWELFERSDRRTVCPFKGEASYWTLTATDPPKRDLAWAYPDPYPEVGGIKGFVAFYHERVRIVTDERWPSDGDEPQGRSRLFPPWGDASDLLRLIDVQPVTPDRFVGPAYRIADQNVVDHQLISRKVVEGGQLLADAVVAASKTVPDQRVTFASMIFTKAATFDSALDVHVDVLRRGRNFSTVEARIVQDDRLRSTGLILLDSGAPDLIRHAVEMPDVRGPLDAEALDMGVSGRDIRVVDGAYSPDPDRVGPPEICTWCRFRDAPAEPYLHTALMAQLTTHWTVGAAMRPHAGVGEADAHVTLSTGIMSIAIAFHDDVDVTEWLLYANRAIYAGRGLAQGEGHVFAAEGRLVASYTVQAVVRRFAQDPGALGLDTRM